MFERFKKFVENTSNDPYFLAQIQCTKALIQFCEKHDYNVSTVDSIRKCLKALEVRDIREATKHYRAVPLGGMGCFNDWWPRAGCEHETDEYACAVFDALVERWSRLMRLSEEKSLS